MPDMSYQPHSNTSFPPCNLTTVSSSKREKNDIQEQHFQLEEDLTNSSSKMEDYAVQPPSPSFTPCNGNSTSPSKKRKRNDNQERIPSYDEEDLIPENFEIIVFPSSNTNTQQQSKPSQPRKKQKRMTTPEQPSSQLSPSPSPPRHRKAESPSCSEMMEKEKAEEKEDNGTNGWIQKLYRFSAQNGKMRSHGSKKMPKRWKAVKVERVADKKGGKSVQDRDGSDNRPEYFEVEESSDSEIGSGYRKFGLR